MNADRKELFEGKTVEDIFSEIYQFSVEERNAALAMFRKLDEFIIKQEDGFMQGDKPSPYLDSAHKATENIIKMLQVANKMKEVSGDTSNGGLDLSDIITLLDEKDIAPDRMKRKKEEKEDKKESTSDFSGKELKKSDKERK